MFKLREYFLIDEAGNFLERRRTEPKEEGFVCWKTDVTATAWRMHKTKHYKYFDKLRTIHIKHTNQYKVYVRVKPMDSGMNLAYDEPVAEKKRFFAPKQHQQPINQPINQPIQVRNHIEPINENIADDSKKFY